MIKILDQNTINKIAAGEVVDRPASVVKELVENALDAGASFIHITVEQGGKSLIQVSDNGHGMGKEDLAFCIQAHATSKIETISDLSHILTYGFRGEALASIASVSDFMIISKLQERIHGYALTLKETHHKEAHTTPTIKPSAANDGTTIVCKNLFSNIPARQKFLKSDAVEFSHILDTFIPLAMIHPETEFTLTHNHKIINRLERGGSFRARIAELLGKHFFSTLIPLRFETDDYKINGYISAPEHAQEKSKHQHIFINKRPVKDFLILKACKTAFSNLIAEKAYPSVILDIQINLEKVDVNVHPKKLEVKHENPAAVFSVIERAIKGVLPSFSPSSLAHTHTIFENEQKSKFFNSKSTPYRTASPFSLNKTPIALFQERMSYQDATETSVSFGQPPPREDMQQQWRLITQLHRSYILIENEKGLLLIDQHAAHERINYERIAEQMDGNDAVQKQLLAVPQTIELSLKEKNLLTAHLPHFNDIGFELEFFGGNTVLVRALPLSLRTSELPALIRNLLNDLSGESAECENTTDELKEKTKRVRRTLLYALACRSAVMFGDVLSEEEQRALVSELAKTKNNQSCVHGRPTSYQISLDDLAKWFKRK